MRACVILCICVVLGVGIISCDRTAPEKTAAPEREDVKAVAPREHSRLVISERGAIAGIKEQGELRVGMQVGYVPFEMMGRDGNVVGFDVDTAELVARSLMVTPRIVQEKWPELISLLLNGEIDVIMSGMTITPARNAEVLFTVPLVETGRMFAVHVTNAERLKGLKDLNQQGIFVVSAPGGLGDLNLREVLPRAAYREFSNSKLAVAEVLEKRAHAVIDDEFAIRAAAAAHPNALMPRLTPITYERVAWAVRPGETHWLNWLDNFIHMMQRDGRLDRLKKKWLHDFFVGPAAR